MVVPPIGPVGLAALALLAAVLVAVVCYGLAELRLAYYVLRSEPNSALDATRGGPIELRGTATRAGGLLRSPFTETPCLAYEYAVEEERQSKNGRSWTTIASGDEAVRFRLDDGSASVLIEPPGADFRLEEHARIDVDGGTAPPDPIRRFVDRTPDVDCQNTSLDLRLFELRTGKDRRFRERILEPGEDVHVLGTARYEPDTSRAAGSVNAAVGIDEQVLSDSHWLRLRHQLFGYPFVISDHTERALGTHAGLRGAAALGAAVAAIAIAVLWLG